MKLFEDLLVIAVLILVPDFLCEKLGLYESMNVLKERRINYE